MRKGYGYGVIFVISMFLAISFLITAIVSLLDPATTVYFVQQNPLFSWMGPTIGYAVHITGNMFFTAVAIFWALNSWRKYNDE